VLVIDDHPLYREGVVDSLNRAGRFRVVGEGATADEAIELADTLDPDLILMDIRIPGDGITATGTIAQTRPTTKIVILTALDDEMHVSRGLQAGACGYVLKGVSGDELASTLEDIARGGAYVSPALAARLLAGRPDTSRQNVSATLTAREQLILRWVGAGLSNREIGEIVGLAERSVKHYMTSILTKLGVRNRIEAAMLAHIVLAKGREN
jgi:DNA-binding NarL/FixJ family response regulator